MNKYVISFVIMTVLMFMSACTANTEKTASQGGTPELVDVDILLPENISLNQESVLKVRVTQGQENVEDPEDIQFEIWKLNGDDSSEMIKAQHEEGGVYSVKKTFSEDGIYYVQTHVTARGMHVMPKKQFIVGNVSEEELNSINQDFQHKEQSHQGHHH